MAVGAAPIQILEREIRDGRAIIRIIPTHQMAARAATGPGIAGVGMVVTQPHRMERVAPAEMVPALVRAVRAATAKARVAED